eukprot:16042-Heterococcus_DN1.PRE.6
MQQACAVLQEHRAFKVSAAALSRMCAVVQLPIIALHSLQYAYQDSNGQDTATHDWRHMRCWCTQLHALSMPLSRLTCSEHTQPLSVAYQSRLLVTAEQQHVAISSER